MHYSFPSVLLPSFSNTQVVQGGDRKTIPTPTLAENTFVMSDDMVVAPRNGRLYLMIRSVFRWALSFVIDSDVLGGDSEKWTALMIRSRKPGLPCLFCCLGWPN